MSPGVVDTFSCLKKLVNNELELIDILLTKKINIGMRSMQESLFWLGGLGLETLCS